MNVTDRQTVLQTNPWAEVLALQQQFRQMDRVGDRHKTLSVAQRGGVGSAEQ